MVDRVESELIRKEQISRQRQQVALNRQRLTLKRQRAANDKDSGAPRTRDAG